MGEENKGATVPAEAWVRLAGTIEEIGQAMGLLREADDDCGRGNHEGGRMCASDALEILSRMEGEFSAMAARLASWCESGAGG